MSLPYFWITVRRKRSRFEHMQTMIQTSSRRLDSFLHEAAQNFELLSNIQDQNKNLKSCWCSFSWPIQLYHSHADPIWPDGTFKKCSRRNIFLFLICFEPNCGEPSPPRSQGRAPSVLFLLLDRVFPLSPPLNLWTKLLWQPILDK